jgi:serine/threonine protein kinase
MSIADGLCFVKAIYYLCIRGRKMALENFQNGRYRLIRLLGKGGMGEVYLVQDERVNRQVAIKVIRSESTPYPEEDTALNAARLFQREAKAIAALEHPNILPLYDFGEEVGEDTTLSYMVMPFCVEGSLANWLRAHGAPALLAPQDVAYFVVQAADALQYAHDCGVIHLDVKPPNFLLRTNKRNPNHPTILLADFGVARSSATLSSSSHTIRGTPTAMAPEQWSSTPVSATDQYALAVMAYEMLTGRPPFVGSMEQLMYQHFTVAPPAPSTFNSALSASVDAVLLRALAKKPEERFPSISAFADAFEQAVTDPSAQPAQFTGQSAAVLADSSAVASDSMETFMMPIGAERGQSATPASGADKSAGVDLTQPVTPQTPRANKSIEHDLPTVVGASWSQITPLSLSPLAPSQVPKKSALQRFGAIGIALMVVLVLVVVVSGALYFTRSAQQESTQAAALTGEHTATALAQVTHAPTVGITPMPTTVPNGEYIPGTYNGSTQDNTTQQSSTISVFLTQKKGSGALGGSMTFTSPNQAVDTLSGIVDIQGNFSFTIQQANGQAALYFYGTVQALSDGNYLKGQYCASNTGSCVSPVGIFDVGPGY